MSPREAGVPERRGFQPAGPGAAMVVAEEEFGWAGRLLSLFFAGI